VPADLEAVSVKVLARDVLERYPTAEAAIAELLRCRDAPRDGRGELVQILAQRIPGNAWVDGGRPDCAMMVGDTCTALAVARCTRASLWCLR
jgi:hypothetical protein